jgi:molecular chaperone IbpA
MTAERLTNWDLRPYTKLSVGLDEFFDELARMSAVSQPDSNYPPYNIVKYNDDTFAIELAVAGFDLDDIDIDLEGNHLIVAGTHKVRDTLEIDYIHRGISSRNFEKTITLGNHIQVNGATMKNGMLTISLIRIVPDELKRRKISITASE